LQKLPSKLTKRKRYPILVRNGDGPPIYFASLAIKHTMVVAIVMVEVEVTVEKPRARQVLLKSKRKFCLQL
jgi:hypothetical protein